MVFCYIKKKIILSFTKPPAPASPNFLRQWWSGVMWQVTGVCVCGYSFSHEGGINLFGRVQIFWIDLKPVRKIRANANLKGYFSKNLVTPPYILESNWRAPFQTAINFTEQ